MPTGALIELILVGLFVVVLIARNVRRARSRTGSAGRSTTGGIWLFGDGDHSGSDFGGDGGGGGD